MEASHTDQLRVTEYVQIILRDTDDRIEKCQKKIKLLKKLASQQNVNVSPVAGKFGVQSPDQLSERLQEIQFSYRYFLKSHGWKEEPSWLDRWLRWDDSISQDYKQLREMTLVLEGQIESSSMHILPDKTGLASDGPRSQPWLPCDEESEGDEWYIGEPPSTPTANTYLDRLSYASALRPFDSFSSPIASQIATHPPTDAKSAIITYPRLPAPRGRVITGGLADRRPR